MPGPGAAASISGRPVALVGTIASRQLVVIASDEARDCGVRPQMTLAQARALCPTLLHAPYTPDRDRRGLESLARWMMRFTPVVSIAQLPSTGNCQLTTGNDSIFLDVTGCGRVFGGLPNLLEQVHQALRSMQLHARLAIAPTPGAAYAIAFAGDENGRIILPAEIRNALTPLPPSALRISPQTAEALYRLGIQTIGQLMQLPRNDLPARFGHEMLTRLDQAIGHIPEPLTALIYRPPIQARIDFDGVVDSLETIWMTFKDLIGQVIAELARRGCGARKIELEFDRHDAPILLKSILLARPSRNAANLFNLIRCATDGMEDNARHQGAIARKGRSHLARLSTNSDSMIPSGFTAIRLTIPLFQPVADEQIPLLEQETHDSQLDLDHLIERLMLRLGDEAIAQARLLESHVPEHAYEAEVRADGSGSSKIQQVLAYPLPLAPYPYARPLHLLNHPTEIRVMVCPSHDCDGRPISFTFDGQTHHVAHAVGPERIAGQWWLGHNRTRDYFAIETETARRWWVFRVRQTSKWYLHGQFE